MSPDLDDNALFDSLMADDGQPEPQPAPEPEPEPPAAEAQVEAPAAAEGDEEIDLASLAPSVRRRIEEADELREKHLNLTRDYAAVHGRLAPMQRRLAELERQPTESGKAQPGPNTATPPTEADTAATVNMTLDQWKQYQAAYPEDARAVQAYVDATIKERVENVTRAAQEQIARLQQQVEAFQPVIHDVRQQAEIGQLSQVHPDWQDINQSPEFWQFISEWVEGLPPHMREQFDIQRDLSRSEVVIPLLTQFKRSRAAPPPPPAPNRQQAAATAAHRLTTAPNVRGNTPPPRKTDTSGMDPNDLFDAISPEWVGHSR